MRRVEEAVPKVGDRVRLVQMPDDPAPIIPGTRGTVTYVTELHMIGDKYQIGVAWDDGRTLSMVVPPDVYEVVDE